MQEPLAVVAPDSYDSLAQILEQALDAVVVVDEARHVMLFNSAAEALWGVDRARVLGHHMSVLTPDCQPGQCSDAAREACNRGLSDLVGAATSREIPLLRPDGQLRWASVSVSKAQTANGIFYTAFIKDVTAQRERDELLRQLQAAVDASDSAILVTHRDGTVAYVNAGVTRLLGYELQDMAGRRASDLLSGPHTDPETLATLRGVIRTDPELAGHVQADVLLYRKDGRPIWMSVVASPVRDATGAVVNYIGTYLDITRTKVYERIQHNALSAIARQMPLIDVMALICREVELVAPEITAAIFAVDGLGRLRTLAAPGLQPETIAAIDGTVIGPQSGSFGAAAYRAEAVLLGPLEDATCCPGIRQAFASYGFRSSWSVPLKKVEGDVVGVITLHYREPTVPGPLHERIMTTCVDVCTVLLEREESRAFLRALASHDPVTGLPNGVGLVPAARKAFAEADRTRQGVNLLFVNIDRFKRINDLHGFTAGDGVLRTIARRLNALAQGRGTVARLTADEFAVLWPGDTAEATALAERILAIRREPVDLEGPSVPVTLRVGIAAYPQDADSLDILLRQADMATAQVERGGDGGYCIYSESLSREAHERLLLEAGLREALRNDTLALHYQPQVAVGCRSLRGVEALLRWRHRDMGDIPPLRFVLVAEECGLIDELGRWALTRACRQLADWRQRGIAVPRIAVNLSPISFRNPGLPRMVTSLLATHGLHPDDLVLEMTEGVMLDADATTMQCIDALCALGMRLSIDDFGTGYSSLSYLHRLPIREIKLDRSFVQDLEHSKAARALTTSVLRIGESLGMEVVAEGVETMGQYDFLAQHGCRLAQGYLFAKPLSPQALEDWLAGWHATTAAAPALASDR